MNNVIQGNCLEEMKGMKADTLDAIITDPPYCSGGHTEASKRASGGHGLRSETLQKNRAAGNAWFKGDNMGTMGITYLLHQMAFQAQRLLKPTGHLLVFCDWRMYPILAPAIEAAGVRLQNMIVWDKGAPGLGRGFRPCHELIMHFTNGSPDYASQTGNLLRVARVPPPKKEHETEKPVELLAQLVRVTTPKGGLVLDPFAGSGSLALACKETGRHFILIERDPKHVATATSRTGQAVTPDLDLSS